MDATDGFFAQLLAAFSMESEEHFNSITTGLVDLERMPSGEKRRGIIETVYRAFHSLKGASRAVDLRDIESVCQVSESLLSLVKRGEVDLSADMLDDLHRAVDGMRRSLTTPSKDDRETLEQLKDALASRASTSAPRADAKRPPAGDAIASRPVFSAEPKPRIETSVSPSPKPEIPGMLTSHKRETPAAPPPAIRPIATAHLDAPPVRISARDLFKKPEPAVGVEAQSGAQTAPVEIGHDTQNGHASSPAASLPHLATPPAEQPVGTPLQMMAVEQASPPPTQRTPEEQAAPSTPPMIVPEAARTQHGKPDSVRPEVQAVQAAGPDLAVSPEPTATSASGQTSPVQPAPVKPETSAPAAVPVLAAPAETIRVGADRLDKVLLQVEELLSVKLGAAHRAARIVGLEMQMVELSVLSTKLSSAVLPRDSASSMQADSAEALSKVRDLVSAHGDLLKAVRAEVSDLARAAEGESRQLDGQLDQLLEDSKKLLLLPMSSVLQAVPKMARDIARGLGKEVDVELVRADTEMDKRILDILKDPVLHIIRNCIDHGIEMPDERLARNKPRRGTIRLTTSPIDSSKIELMIEDDGGGIDRVKLKTAALKNGAVSPEAIQGMDDEHVLGLIFQSGVSTSGIITDLSGRGLGMAIARDTIEEVGGSVAVSSTPGAGSTFRIILPVSHTTLRCIVFKLEGQTFMAPATHVDQVCRVPRSAVVNVAGGRTIALNGVPVPLWRLSDLLRIPVRPTPPPACMQLIVMTASGKTIACQVDEILYEQETLVKPLGPQLLHVRHIAGAAILGTGEPVPILNVRELLHTAQDISGHSSEASQAAEETVTRDRILVVDDSITSRMLIKNILETVDYQVTVAVDGMEALRILKERTVDLVISDVEMPRMDGFTLTENLRKNPETAELPVILVTSLEAREDRERGVSAGANAYIVKRTFDQGNLLDTVQRLI